MKKRKGAPGNHPMNNNLPFLHHYSDGMPGHHSQPQVAEHHVRGNSGGPQNVPTGLGGINSHNSNGNAI